MVKAISAATLKTNNSVRQVEYDFMFQFIALVVVALAFLGVVIFALHRKGDVEVSMSIFKRLLEVTISAKDSQACAAAVVNQQAPDKGSSGLP